MVRHIFCQKNNLLLFEKYIMNDTKLRQRWNYTLFELIEEIEDLNIQVDEWRDEIESLRNQIEDMEKEMRDNLL